MRTTITLDPDVAVRLQKIMRERGLSMKAAVNSLLRKGMMPGGGKGRRFRMKTYDMGPHAADAFDRALAMADALLVPLGTGGNLTSDAHLAALSLEHRGTVLTYDHDFGRFPGVKWKSPE